ncbi:hypothetical protein F5Y14DRAFT_424856 [Nemania sp. NC0429]|nr:hypothetical protein F5Y14DRAFT_424856 [Nemania sp. NC0429]
MYIPNIHGRGSVFRGPGSEGREAKREQQVFPVSHITADGPIANARHYHPLARLIQAILITIFTDPGPSPAVSLSPSTTSSLGKRAATDNPNTTTSVVAGILVSAFVILAGVFLYVYRKSIHFRKQSRKRRRHRHRRRPSGVSKNSQTSEVAGGGGAAGGDAGGDAAAAADPGAQA